MPRNFSRANRIFTDSVVNFSRDRIRCSCSSALPMCFSARAHRDFFLVGYAQGRGNESGQYRKAVVLLWLVAGFTSDHRNFFYSAARSISISRPVEEH